MLRAARHADPVHGHARRRGRAHSARRGAARAALAQRRTTSRRSTRRPTRFATIVTRAFPRRASRYDVDVKRQGIVDSWPAAWTIPPHGSDWGFAPAFDLVARVQRVPHPDDSKAVSMMTDVLPQTMTAIEIRTPGAPEVLTPVSRPMPALGDDDVLVRVRAAGVNRPDLMQRQGKYPPPPGASDIPGLEVAGEVAAVGARRAALARRRSRHGPRRRRRIRGVLRRAGAAMPADSDGPVGRGGRGDAGDVLHRLDERLRARTARARRDAARPRRHERHRHDRDPAGDACSARGSSPRRDPRQSARPASGSAPSAPSTTRPMTSSRSSRTITGGKRRRRHPRHGRRRLSAAEPRRARDRRPARPDLVPEGSHVELNLNPLMRKRLTLTGSTLRPRTADEKGVDRASARGEGVAARGPGELRPVIHATFPLRDAPLAHAALEAGDHVGKIVLTVESAELSGRLNRADRKSVQMSQPPVQATLNSERRLGYSPARASPAKVRQAWDEGRGQREPQGPARQVIAPGRSCQRPCPRPSRRLRSRVPSQQQRRGRHAGSVMTPFSASTQRAPARAAPQHEDAATHAPHVTPRTMRARTADRRVAARPRARRVAWHMGEAPFDQQEHRKRERGERGGDAEGRAEAGLADQPAGRRGSCADARVEGREDRAERRAAPGFADIPHHPRREGGIRRAEPEREDARPRP